MTEDGTPSCQSKTTHNAGNSSNATFTEPIAITNNARRMIGSRELSTLDDLEAVDWDGAFNKHMRHGLVGEHLR